MSDSEPSLKSIRESAAALNQLSDEANQTVGGVEDALNEFGVGSGQYVLVKAAEDLPRKTHCQFLECRRINEKHRICVVWTKANTLDDETVFPWSDCSRTEKLQTIKKLPALLDTIHKALMEQLAVATDAKPSINRVRKILETYKEGK